LKKRSEETSASWALGACATGG